MEHHGRRWCSSRSSLDLISSPRSCAPRENFCVPFRTSAADSPSGPPRANHRPRTRRRQPRLRRTASHITAGPRHLRFVSRSTCDMDAPGLWTGRVIALCNFLLLAHGRMAVLPSTRRFGAAYSGTAARVSRKVFKASAK